MYRVDAAFMTVFLLVGAAIVWLTQFFPDTGERFGPGFVPRVLAVLLIGFTGVLAVEWLWVRRRQRFLKAAIPRGFTVRAVVFTAALVSYVAVLGLRTPLGFPGWTALFLLGTGYLFGGRSLLGLVTMAIATSFGLYVFFRVWLHVMLPSSALF